MTTYIVVWSDTRCSVSYSKEEAEAAIVNLLESSVDQKDIEVYVSYEEPSKVKVSFE